MNATNDADDWWNRANLPIHSQTPPIVSAPSLVWHRIYWRSINPELEHTHRTRTEIEGRLKQHSKDPGACMEALRSSRSQSFLQGDVCLLGERIHVRVELRSEHLSITAILPLHWSSGLQLKTPNDLSGLIKNKHMAVGNTVFGEVPNELRFIFDAATWFAEPLSSKTNLPCIGDFRGLVTLHNPHFTKSELPSWSKTPITREAPEAPPVFKRSGQSEASRADIHDKPDDWYTDVFQPYRNTVVKPCLPELDPEDDQAVEFSATGLLNGRALLVTNLGADTAVASNKAKGTGRHVRFFLHVRDNDEWQIGRLVHRICAMASNRVLLALSASLAGDSNKAVREAVARIEAVSRRLNDRYNMVAPIMSNAKDLGRQEITKITTFVSRYNKVWSFISRLFYEITVGKSGGLDTDLRYRIQRARYYQFKYREIMEELRTRRVEGYQTYQEFVMRRMRDQISLVESMRTKLNGLEAQYAFLANKMAEINALSTAADAAQQQRKIEKIQDFGEFALIVFLIPYYLGYVLQYPLGHLLEMDHVYSGFILSFLAGLGYLVRAAYTGQRNIFNANTKRLAAKRKHSAYSIIVYIHIAALLAIAVALCSHGGLASIVGSTGKQKASSESDAPLPLSTPQVPPDASRVSKPHKG